MDIKRILSKAISLFLISIFFFVQPGFPGLAQVLNPELPQEETKNFFPLILVAIPPPTDLTISAIEVSQATQGATNHVSLVNGRPTTVRVYARVNEAVPLSNVSVALFGSRNGLPLPGSPLVSTASSAYPLSTSATTLRLDINKSYNFSLPVEWLAGQVSLEARVDSNNAYWENNESNNSFTYTANYITVPPLNVKIVPIRYYDTYYKKTFELSSEEVLKQANEFKSAMMKIYPVGSIQMQVRSSTYTFQGDLGDYYNLSDWDRLLDNIVTLKYSDGSPASEVYYGLIPVVDSTGFSWWYSGVLGYGFVGPPTYGGPRAAIGLASGYVKAINYTVEGEVTAAHEIGHNLGRLHAPCGGPSDVDPLYPYSGGIIGQIGLDPNILKIYYPTSNYDIMGYCDNVWISDYNYSALMQSQLLFGSTAAEIEKQESLLLSGRIDETGRISFQPSYILPTYPLQTTTQSDFQVQFFDENGQVISTHFLPVSLAQAEEFSSIKISASIPLPEKTPSGIRILKDGAQIFQKSFGKLDKLAPGIDSPQITIQAAGPELNIRWGLPDQPALLRYSVDGGLTWMTLDAENTAGSWTGLIPGLTQQEILFQVIPAWSLEAVNLHWSAEDIE